MRTQDKVVVFLVIFALLVSVSGYSFPEVEWNNLLDHRPYLDYKHIVANSDGTYVVGGTRHRQNNTRCILSKLDNFGDLVWSRVYGDTTHYMHALIRNGDAGFYFASDHKSLDLSPSRDDWSGPISLSKVDQGGNLVWTVSFENASVVTDILLHSNGMLYLTGYKRGPAKWHPFLITFDSDGNLIDRVDWESDAWIQIIYSLIETDDRRIAMSGYYDGQIVFYKTDSTNLNFEIVDSNNPPPTFLGRSDIFQDSQGNYFVYGFTSGGEERGNSNLFMVKYNELGEFVWDRTHGLGPSLYSGKLDEIDGNQYLLIAPSVENENQDVNGFGFVKFDSGGNVTGRRVYERIGCNLWFDIDKTPDGGYIICNTRSPRYLIKLSDPNVVNQSRPVDMADNFWLSDAYPNPFNSTTTISYGLQYPGNISLQLYDVTGQYISTLFEGRKQAGVYSVNLDGKDLTSGLYFVRLDVGGEVFTRKVMLIR